MNSKKVVFVDNNEVSKPNSNSIYGDIIKGVSKNGNSIIFAVSKKDSE